MVTQRPYFSALWTEKAKRTIFFAKHEADQVGSPEIKPEHILLGLLEDAILVKRILPDTSLDEVREDILEHQPEKGRRSGPGDLPLSPEAEQILTSAAEEAHKSGSRYVGNGHILLGLLRADNSYVAEMLRREGILVEEVRAQVEELALKELTQAERLIQMKGIEVANEPTIEQTLLDLAKREGHRQALKRVHDLLAEPGRDRESTLRELWFIATVLSRSIGDLQLAKHYCEERLACDPEDPHALYAMADCLQMQGHLDEAKRYAAKSYAIVRSTDKARGLLDLLTNRWPDIQ